MSRLILEGDDKQIALLLKLAENMTDVDIVEHVPEASGLNDDDKKSPLYWLDQIRHRGGVSYAIVGFSYKTSIILKPPILIGGQRLSTTYIYHLFKNITSDVMFLKR